MDPAAKSEVVTAYLDLLKRAILNEIHEDHEYLRKPPEARRFLAPARPADELRIAPRRIDPAARDAGAVWPPSAMAHSTIFMRGCLLALGDADRTVWVADSFAGLPVPDPAHAADAGDVHHTIAELAVSLEQVQSNFGRYGLLDDRVRFLKGWFKDTLPAAPIRELAVMRLDGDMYGSTIEALQALYPKLSPGGFAIIDDYCIASCRQAVADFRAANGITEAIVDIDRTGVFWRKNRSGPM
jgi:hypothetical protein